MANPYHGENSQQNKTGGSGVKVKPTGPPNKSLRMHVDPKPGLPGKSGPNRTAGYQKLQQHAQTKGL